MRALLYIAVFMLTGTAPSYPQDHDTFPRRPDSLPHTVVKGTADTSKIIDNSSTVELIIQSQTQKLVDSARESIFREQISQLGQSDTKQRREILFQMEALRKKDSLRRAEIQNRIDSLKQNAKGAPVILRQDTLYLIYTNIGSITPNERAKLNTEKILKVAKIFSLKADSLSIVEEDNAGYNIMYGDMIISSITEIDAIWMDSTPRELAEKYRERMLEAIVAYKESIGLLNILKISGLSLLVLTGLYFSLKGTSVLFRRVIDRKLKARKERLFKWLKIKSVNVIDQGKALKIALFIAKLSRYAIYAILCYLALLLLFSIFPPTQRLAQILLGWIWAPLTAIVKSFGAYLPNLFKIIVIAVVFRYVVKFCRYLTNGLDDGKIVIPGFYSDWAKATFNIVRILLYAFMLVLIFPYLPGSGSGVFQGVSVFIGVLFTLGSTSVIGNLMAGMVITYMRPFRINDRIKIGDVLGDVVEKSPFVIRIKTNKNEIVTVPNSTVLSSNVINYSATSVADEGLIINTTVTMGYDLPWRKVNQLLVDAALKTEFILDHPKPFVLQTELTDFSATYQLCAYTKTPGKQAFIYSQLHQNIQDVFQAAGVEMTTLHYNAIRNGDKSTIPPEYQPKTPESDHTGKGL
jgi:small-conductance mechanosensitive channel